MNLCNTCQIKKNKANFTKTSKTKCRACTREYNQKRWATDKESIQKQSKKYKQSARGKALRNKRQRAMYKADPQKRIVQCIASAVTHLFDGSIKTSWILDYVGCSLEEWKNHIASQFKEGMDWTNRGGRKGNWSIDHIVPISSLDLSVEENLHKALYFKNTTPLWAEENSRKHNKTDWVPKELPKAVYDKAERTGLSPEQVVLRDRETAIRTNWLAERANQARQARKADK